MIVLKSTSPRRKELLEKAHVKFKVAGADIEERLDPAQTPYDNVKRLGLEKALVDRSSYPNDILIGCDTIVVLDNQIYGKPKDRQDAFQMLKNLSGKKHQVMSGVGIVLNDRIKNFVVVSDVYFKSLSDEQIHTYIDSGECFGKAGGYAIQGLGRNLIDHYDGSLDNIIGLPIAEVLKELEALQHVDD